MIEATAIVSRVIANQVWVHTDRSSSCGKCSNDASCATQLLGKYIAQREHPVDTELSLERGDRIIVGINENQLLKSSLLVYILPLFGLFIGALLGDRVASFWAVVNVELIIIFSAVTGFIIILMVINKYQDTILARQFHRPVVIRRL